MSFRTCGSVLALLATIAVFFACNSHDAPLGGDCDRGEDCGAGTLTCYKPAGQSRGHCSQTCVVSPPKGTIQGAAGCDSGGLVCAKANAAHPILGEEYCVKP